ncbi:hypothetical protein [Streptomyces sp. GESEQ-4]|uniref:hypothetical protein n=1 Tax=Streptomyces sp. GESEQ-4 TaxID=2812655 RepID=UPI001B335DFC|nr:hypothetical protein [Streptomyces sp. GESEQ-4]
MPDPLPGRQLPAYSDEFDGSSLSPDWTWVRGPAAGTATGDGVLSWPTQNAELHLGTNTASVLTRPAPPGDFTVETKPVDAARRAAARNRPGLPEHGRSHRTLRLRTHFAELAPVTA